MTELNNLRLGEIDLSLKPLQYNLFLCRPDKTTIMSLKDINGLKYNKKLGIVDELSFSIPTKIEKNHELIDNPLIKDIKHRYLFKLIFNNVTSYFTFYERNKEYGSNNTVSYRSYGLGYELGDKDIRNYEATSKLLTEILHDLLAETVWKIGYVDAYFDTKYRSHTIDTSNVLQSLYDLAEKFNAIIVWDTKELKVNFYNPSNIGRDKGFRFKRGKYLESFNLGDNSEEVITRLKLYGNDGLSIRRLTPTGTNYLEDFSWYMYPFKRDDLGNVVSKSDYMSDELCIALEDYHIVLSGVKGQFDVLLKLLKSTQTSIQEEAHKLSLLMIDMVKLLDERDVYNSTKDGDIADITSRIVAKETEINTVETAINDLTITEKSTQSDIDSLRLQTKIESHLSGKLLIELNRFITIKEYTNDMIIDEEDLLEEGIEVFEKYRQPQVNLSMNIYNFLNNIESQNDYDKLGLGDKVGIYSESLDVDIKAKITEIEYDFDSDSINLQIANEIEVADSDSKFLDMIYSSNSASNTVNMNKFKWGLIEDTNSIVSQILNEEWDANKRKIIAGYKQNIVIGDRGIVIKSDEDPLDWLVIQNGMLAITNDAGNTWKHAVTSSGIIGDRIIGRILMGSRLLIEDEDGIIKLSGSKQQIFDNEGNEKVVLGKIDENQYGLKVHGGAIEIVGGLDGDNINPSYTESVKYDDKILRGELRLTSPLPNSIKLNSDGITAYTANTTNFARMDYRGLYIQGGAVDIRTSTQLNKGIILDGNGFRGYKSDGTESIRVDINGDAKFSGDLVAAKGTFTGELVAAEGTFTGNLVAAKGTFTGKLEAASGTFSGTLSSGIINGGKITGADITGNEINGGTITGTIINGGTINGTTINSTGEYGTTKITGAVVENTYNGSTVALGQGFLEVKGQYGVSDISASGLYTTDYSGNRTSYEPAGINASRYSTGTGSFYIDANLSLIGDVNFSRANVTGLNVTAVFG